MTFKKVLELHFLQSAAAIALFLGITGCASPASFQKQAAARPTATLPQPPVAPSPPPQSTEPRVIGLAEEIEQNAMQMMP